MQVMHQHSSRNKRRAGQSSASGSQTLLPLTSIDMHASGDLAAPLLLSCVAKHACCRLWKAVAEGSQRERQRPAGQVGPGQFLPDEKDRGEKCAVGEMQQRKPARASSRAASPVLARPPLRQPCRRPACTLPSAPRQLAASRPAGTLCQTGGPATAKPTCSNTSLCAASFAPSVPRLSEAWVGRHVAAEPRAGRPCRRCSGRATPPRNRGCAAGRRSAAGEVLRSNLQV